MKPSEEIARYFLSRFSDEDVSRWRVNILMIYKYFVKIKSASTGGNILLYSMKGFGHEGIWA